MSDDRKPNSAAPALPERPPGAKPVSGPFVPAVEAAPDPGLADLVPARMINEVLYCERLLYLEWVQGEWEDNIYTVEGKAAHRRVDGKPRVLKPLVKATKASPREEAEGASKAASNDADARPYVARSVWLSSERLGMTAKIDVVDVDGSVVVPVEYKRGKCPDRPGGPWLPERAQVAAQVLLLRAHGYDCPHGEIYYAGDRRRVPIEITEELIEATLGAVARARELAAAGRLPGPIEDNPKCHGCSLSGICLPDETRSLREVTSSPEHDPQEVGDDPWGLAPTEEQEAEKQEAEEQDAEEQEAEDQEPAEGLLPTEELLPGERAAAVQPLVRRLYPARDDKVPLYVQEQGAALRLAGERLVVTRKDQPAIEARVLNTSSVNLYGNVHVTMPALRRLMEDGIPVAFHTYGGWFVGRAVGADPKNVELHLAQYRAVTDEHFCLNHARSLIASKILNCRTLLRRNHGGNVAVPLGELKQLARKARDAEAIESLLGVEGTAARAYFQSFSGMIKDDEVKTFDFERRNRRPPTDPVNALLSFCYGMLAKACALAIASVGLDPLLGFYHRPHFGRPSLALDLMEEFRPVIADSVVVGAINNGVIQAGDFVTAAGAVALSSPARKRLIVAFERRMDQLVTHPVFDYRVSYRRVLEVQARLLSRLMLREITAYPEFRVR